MVKRYFELYGYEITKKKIRNGLMVEIRAHEESVCHVDGISSDEEKQQAKSTFNARMKAWETLFQTGGLGLHEDLFKIINPKTFHHTDKQLAQFIMQLYSLDTIVYDLITEAAFTKDESKVKNLGPYTCILRAILYGNQGLSSQVAYRGILLTRQ